MRAGTIATSLWLALPGLAAVDRPAASAEATETDVLLASLTMPLRIEGRSLQGPGADWLLARAAEADFFLLGEQHTTAEIGLLSAGLFERLVPAGYAVAAIEVGPWSTRRLESMLRDGEAFEHYLAEPAHRTVFPFYGLREDTEFLRTVIARSPRRADVLWGLDQEFVGAAPVLLDELARLATSDAQLAAVTTMREASRADRMALARAAMRRGRLCTKPSQAMCRHGRSPPTSSCRGASTRRTWSGAAASISRTTSASAT